MPHELRRIHCDCCDLDQKVRVDDAYYGPIPVCTDCQRHRGADAETLIRRGEEHVTMYRELLLEAETDADNAYRKAERNWERMKSAYRTREAVVRALWQIGNIHELRPNGCKCGKRDCKIANVLARRTVNGLIDRYDREQERLERALREDEDRWLSEWDKIDPETGEDDDYGVYPRHDNRQSDGREAG